MDLLVAELRRLIVQRESQLTLINLIENYWKQNAYNKFTSEVQLANDTYDVFLLSLSMSS